MGDAAAAAAAHLRSMRMKMLSDSCSSLQARAVTVLSLKDPEGDWHRWADELLAVIQTYGQDFTDAVEFAMDIPAVVPPGVLDDEPAPLTAPQMRQQALRAFIGNSLPSSLAEGTPAYLIRDCRHAGGTIAGAPQALAVLRTRYEIARPTKDPSRRLHTSPSCGAPSRMRTTRGTCA